MPKVQDHWPRERYYHIISSVWAAFQTSRLVADLPGYNECCEDNGATGLRRPGVS